MKIAQPFAHIMNNRKTGSAKIQVSAKRNTSKPRITQKVHVNMKLKTRKVSPVALILSLRDYAAMEGVTVEDLATSNQTIKARDWGVKTHSSLIFVLSFEKQASTIVIAGGVEGNLDAHKDRRHLWQQGMHHLRDLEVLTAEVNHAPT